MQGLNLLLLFCSLHPPSTWSSSKIKAFTTACLYRNISCSQFYEPKVSFSIPDVAQRFLSLGNIHALSCHINLYPSSALQSLFQFCKDSNNHITSPHFCSLVLVLSLSNYFPGKLVTPVPSLFQTSVSSICLPTILYGVSNTSVTLNKNTQSFSLYSAGLHLLVKITNCRFSSHLIGILNQRNFAQKYLALLLKEFATAQSSKSTNHFVVFFFKLCLPILQKFLKFLPGFLMTVLFACCFLFTFFLFYFVFFLFL